MQVDTNAKHNRDSFVCFLLSVIFIYNTCTFLQNYYSFYVSAGIAVAFMMLTFLMGYKWNRIVGRMIYLFWSFHTRHKCGLPPDNNCHSCNNKALLIKAKCQRPGRPPMIRFVLRYVLLYGTICARLISMSSWYNGLSSL